MMYAPLRGKKRYKISKPEKKSIQKCKNRNVKNKVLDKYQPDCMHTHAYLVVENPPQKNGG